MEAIRYLPKSDLAVPLYLENSKALLCQIQEKEFLPDINTVVSIFNILRYMDDGLEQQLDNPDRESLMRVIIEFCQSNSPIEILSNFNQLTGWIDDDFWSFFAKFRIEKRLKEEDFEAFLSSKKPNIGPILVHPLLQRKFRRSLRDYFLSDIENVRYLLAQKEVGHRPAPAIPLDITTKDKLLLISAYMDSENPSIGNLEIFSKSKEVPSKVRLAAQRRAKDARMKFFESAATFKCGVEVSYREQEEAVEVNLEDGILKYNYDINWIQNNSNKATLLNNFIYLFNYIDEQSRLTLCFQASEQSALEHTMSTQRTDWYPESMFFRQKNQAALLQLQSYSHLLNSLDTSIEELINWFFKNYTKDEFEINNFQADIPLGDRPFIEKCKLLAPEIERTLRQFQLLVEDGQIDHDLIALETNPFTPSITGSFLEKKYCYLESENGKIATFFFYSDQCMLNYDSRSNKSYKSFANRLALQRPHKDEFEKYELPNLDWLEENGYLRFDDEGVAVVTNVCKVVFLGEIFRNGCLCYDAYDGVWKNTLDIMIAEGTLRVESSLFSEPEAKYIDYHLNQRSYINSLDLRNKYAHGSHWGSGEKEQEHEYNYFQMLKIMVCIVLKINDELCRKYKTTCYDKNTL